MKMTRYFFISDDLDELERFEEELENADLVTPQIHLLTLDDGGAANHQHLHEVTALMKTNVLHSMLYGAAVGLVASIFLLALAHLAGWTESAAGWLPFIFLAVIVLGFFTWEGGLWGIDTPNQSFDHFEEAIRGGKHLFFVDVLPGKGHRKILESAVGKHPKIELAGTARGAPHWIVNWQYGLKRFFTETFP